ncbi:hypothetical protein SLEP1_g40150 [Rubroshorea leprosula]|uniref:Uncharacterized protein n=1 Tax=Rubroshorea leprosula TaxID=152421 RepID=A0AAV5L2J0_9ROSI|nr:hypothetical protein SLEP1_g40150 [Rubroshorea leprosula]
MAAELVPSALELIARVEAVASLKGVRLGRDSKNELQRLGRNLLDLNAYVKDVEQGRIDDIVIQGWIDPLTDAAYDVVDVLDEWITTLVKLRIKGVGKTSILKAKVGSYITHCLHTAQVVRRDDLAFKLKEITDRLDVIANEINLLCSIASLEFHHSRRLVSTALVDDVSAIIGRDEVKGDIVSSLLSASTERLKTISIVGMGGVGKTAIAQLVYHDEEVKQHFDRRLWVCVSDVFDENNVAKTIIEGVEGFMSFGVDSLDSFPLSALLDRMCRSIHGKKFFLVLDDVWADDKRQWEGLIQTFKHGAPGSRILLTTRKDTVANMMDSHVIHLQPLSDEQCWMLVSQEAFSGRGVEECQNLEDIGKRISNKCKGLPLVAKELGRLLIFKSSRTEWEDILHSEIRKLEIAHLRLFPSLLLSYNDLPLPLRQCFKYCAVFPKDFVYDGETIMYHWMAQGYLGLNNDEDLELKGRKYISYLAARSFLHDFLLDTDGIKSTWKMHDIMHDFAQFLVINDGIVIEVNSEGNSMTDLSSRKAHYLTACIPEGHCLPTSIYGAEKLRSLMIISGENAITNEALQIIFNQAKQLRLVNFGCHNALVDKIPNEIGNLIHLRHINLSGSEIKGLPRSLCELHNLQYLNLNNSKSLENLPDEIGNLINLIYLGTLHCYKLACYPKSARRLTNLRQLCGIVLRADRNDPKEFTLGDLENLNFLRELSMVLKGNAVNDRELKRAKFENKTDLKDIELESLDLQLDQFQNLNQFSLRVLNPSHGLYTFTEMK